MSIQYKLLSIDGLYFEITDCDDKEYKCTFIEEKDGERIELYSSNLRKGHWMKINRRYIGNYFVEIRTMNDVLKERISFLNHLKGKRVFITFDSSALGDSIAWMPYCLEFQKKYQCTVIVSTFKNFLFDYPELQWAKPGDMVDDIVAMPQLGWFWDGDKEPVNPVTVPLQQTATNILHLPYKEMRPKLIHKALPIGVNKHIAISVQSTAQLKLWDGWQELVNELINKGYKVSEVSKDRSNLVGVEDVDNASLEKVMDIIDKCEFYIGLSSGISWLAWAMNKRVIMISNFTEANHEFKCVRVDNRNVCNGCWNNPMFRFDKGNWAYCPVHEDTPRQHECHKSISVNDVINKINLF